MATTSIRLRLATTADTGLLLPWTMALNLHEDIHLESGALLASLEALLDDPCLGAIYVVERDGSAIGYALTTYSYDLEFGGREAWLTELWIAESSRGAGVGADVLRLLERELAARDVKAVHLQVRPDNPAKRLYDRLGWEASPRIVMTRRIS